MRRRPKARLLVSIHDVSPAHADVLPIMLQMTRSLGVDRGLLLVVPNFHGCWPLGDHPRLCQMIQTWLDSGWELTLHGYTHLDDAAGPTAVSSQSRWRRLLGRHATAHEGEFLSLTESAATTRLDRGSRELAHLFGRAPVGFVPPAWLCGPEAASAVAASDLRYTEDHLYFHDLGAQKAHLCPPISWASRSRLRRWASLAWATGSRLALAQLPLVRVALHPGDFSHRPLIRSIARTLTDFLEAGFELTTGAEIVGS